MFTRKPLRTFFKIFNNIHSEVIVKSIIDQDQFLKKFSSISGLNIKQNGHLKFKYGVILTPHN